MGRTIWFVGLSKEWKCKPFFKKPFSSILLSFSFTSNHHAVLFVVLFAVWCASSSVKILMGWVQTYPDTHDCIAAAVELMEGKGMETRSLMSQGSHWTSLIKHRFKHNILVNFKTKTAKHWILNSQGSVWLWWLHSHEVEPGSRKYLNFTDEDTLTTRKKVFFVLFCGIFVHCILTKTYYSYYMQLACQFLILVDF